MTVIDRYLVPAEIGEGEFRDRGSKFVAALLPVRSEAQALAAVDEQSRLHSKCNHHCYAYRIGPGTDRWRTSDDGEPSGTAGKPILGQIDKHELSDIVIVVSRYFGGTKLGTSGLINAYREAARLALEATHTEIRLISDTIMLRFNYTLTTPVMSALSHLGLEMIEQDFGESAMLKIELPRSTTENILKELKATIAGVYLEEVREDFNIPGLEITVHSPYSEQAI